MSANGDLERGPEQIDESSSRQTSKPDDPRMANRAPSGAALDDGWIHVLQESHDIEVRQITKGDTTWTKVPVEKISDPSQLPTDVHTRLFLVEGLARKTIEYFSSISLDFFHGHFRNTLPYDRHEPNENYFFAKWHRRVDQTLRLWEILNKILQGRPYDLDILVDPERLGMNHLRYGVDRRMFRPRSSLDIAGRLSNYVRSAIEDCISVHHQYVDHGAISKYTIDMLRRKFAEICRPSRCHI